LLLFTEKQTRQDPTRQDKRCWPKINSYSQEAVKKNNLSVVQWTSLQLAYKQSLTPAQTIQWIELQLFSLDYE